MKKWDELNHIERLVDKIRTAKRKVYKTIRKGILGMANKLLSLFQYWNNDELDHALELINSHAGFECYKDDIVVIIGHAVFGSLDAFKDYDAPQLWVYPLEELMDIYKDTYIFKELNEEFDECFLELWHNR